MNKNILVKNVKTEVFKNGVVIPKYVLIDNKLDVNTKYIVSFLLHLWENHFDREDFLIHLNYLDIIGLENCDFDVDEILWWLDNNSYFFILNEFSIADDIWYRIGINPIYEKYINLFEAKELQNLTYTEFYEELSLDEVIPPDGPDPLYKIVGHIISIPEEWNNLLEFLESRSRCEKQTA